ncbi:hypothetical protein AMAG_15460 [Allomyces macrogynus ATCC 38327]|uniref:Uncharacterized protein n=1 Tax=Allomyces macrogynus (strain ATCC 38327) TaxID=578462 RepID=A0A0L0T7J8_ALLM3|nr:hypothetical protein AMAG_15460 [Allomyces macrogynus ATCC 38327]|eukprot:KNE70705.1 hypothetical protein AMAG_15460 [Allomyces macrogynus ATCC 38327]
MWLNVLIITTLSAVLIVDHYLPEYGTPRFLTASYSASGLSLLASYTTGVLTELYARNSLRAVVVGTDEDGLLMHLSFSAINDGVTSIAQRMVKEVRSKGVRGVEPLRLRLVMAAVTAWAATTAWDKFSANYVQDGTVSLFKTSTESVPMININNPFGLAECATELKQGSITYRYDRGMNIPLGTMLEELYAAADQNAEQAARNATTYYLDDFVPLSLPQNTAQYMVMLPTTPTSFYQYNSTLIGINVTCAITPGSKALGSLSNATTLRAQATLPSGYVTIVNTTVNIARGYTLLSDLNSTLIAATTNDATNLAVPGCAYGLCSAFASDMTFGLHCGMDAVAFTATVTKAGAAAGTTNQQRTIVTPHTVVSSLATGAAGIPNAIRDALTGWSSVLQWSWIARAYRVVYDPATYVSQMTVENVAKDYQTVLAYAVLGLIHRPHSYSLNVTGTGSSSGCTSAHVAGSSSSARITVKTPNLAYVSDSVVLTKTLAQTKYAWVIAVFAGIAAALLFAFLPAVIMWPACCTRKRMQRVAVDETGGMPQAKHALPLALRAGHDGFETAVRQTLRGSSGGSAGGARTGGQGGAVVRLLPAKPVPAGTVDVSQFQLHWESTTSGGKGESAGTTADVVKSSAL